MQGEYYVREGGATIEAARRGSDPLSLLLATQSLTQEHLTRLAIEFHTHGSTRVPCGCATAWLNTRHPFQ
jgi:hypothetical protein